MDILFPAGPVLEGISQPSPVSGLVKADEIALSVGAYLPFSSSHRGVSVLSSACSLTGMSAQSGILVQ